MGDALCREAPLTVASLADSIVFLFILLILF